MQKREVIQKLTEAFAEAGAKVTVQSYTSREFEVIDPSVGGYDKYRNIARMKINEDLSQVQIQVFDGKWYKPLYDKKTYDLPSATKEILRCRKEVLAKEKEARSLE